MKYKITYLFICICLVSFASANLGTVQRGECVEIIAPLNSSAVNISTIHYPNFTLATSNQAMTKVGGSFNYTFCNTNDLGVYLYTFHDITNQESYGNSFTVTYTGQSVNLSNSVVPFIMVTLSFIFILISRSFSKEHWVLRTFFDFMAVGMGILAINSVRIIASESLNLTTMTGVGLTLMIVTFSLFFIYMFVYAFIEAIKSFREKRGVRWSFDD